MFREAGTLRIHRCPFVVLLIVILGLYSVHGATGAVYYVDDDAAPGGDGSSWGTAYTYLQDALYDPSLSYGDTIRVAGGTYTPDKDEQGNVTVSDRTSTFQLVNGVKLIGGYAGMLGLHPDERNVDAHISILSGDLCDTIENSFHVVVGSGTDPNTILDGFTITGGSANRAYPNQTGGGMYNRAGSPTVYHCIFRDNQAYWGSAVYNHSNSNATFIGCVLKNNKAFGAGAMYNENNSSLTVIDCTITDNNNSGMYNIYSQTQVLYCTITTNNNSGLYNAYSPTEVLHCTITGNGGTGIYNYFSNSRVEHCILSHNSAVHGAGMYNDNSSPMVINCTFSRNVASQYGGGIYNSENSYPAIISCILWGNTASSGSSIYNDGASEPSVEYSDIQGGWIGRDNIDLDPLFSDPDGGDYHLKSQAGRWDDTLDSWVQDTVTSVCIDRGSPAGSWLDEPSPNGGRINMGAYGGTVQASRSDTLVPNNHPADRPNVDMQIIISELTAYGSDWKTGQEWPADPNPIPINFVTRAGYLWKNGERYSYDPHADPPLCWELNAPAFRSLDSSVQMAGPSTVHRYFDSDRYTPGEPVQVTIYIEPGADVSSYAVEDQPPAGWEVSDINEDGNYDRVNKKVKWFYFDTEATAKTCQYQAIPPIGESGIKTFSAIYSTDGGQENIVLQIEAEEQWMISGTVRTSGDTGISGVTMSGLPGTPMTSASGYYTATVSSGFSGTVTPSKADYQFDPVSRTYTGVSADQLDQDFRGMSTSTISGTVRTSGGSGISGVTMSGLPGSPVTDGSGYYSATVPPDWSGMVTPGKASYTFSPPSISYSHVTSNQADQNYIGTYDSSISYVISGFIKTSSGSGIGGVTLSGFADTVTTDSDGYYTATVPAGFSGTVTPGHAGYTFDPPTRSYSAVSSDPLNQDYTGTLRMYTLSGYVQTAEGNGISGVTLNSLPGSPVTDSHGYYSDTVPYGWTGVIVPSKPRYSFTPPSRNYAPVTAAQDNQDYHGTYEGPVIHNVPGEYTTIQAAINAAFDGDTVVVADGTYSGDGNRDLDLLGKSITVTSNNSGPETCIIDCGGTENDPHRGFNIHSYEDPNSIVDGFTIINGYAGLDGGGGIYCQNSSPVIRNCVLRDNATDGSGGGIAYILANPVIETCTISGNTAAHGAGLYAGESDVVMDTCIIQDNWTSLEEPFGHGGGIHITDHSSLSVRSSKIIANTAVSGGGIYCEGSSYAAILNSLLSGNLSQAHGGAVYVIDSDGMMVNCTTSGNRASFHGGAIRVDGESVLDIYNSIFWGDMVSVPGQGNEIALGSGATVNVFSSNVEGSQSRVLVEAGGILNWGTDNLDINPQFMNPGYWQVSDPSERAGDAVWIKGEYCLLPPSFCIDAGDDTLVTDMDADIVGTARILGSAVDLGAYEYAGSLASSLMDIRTMTVRGSKRRDSQEGGFGDLFMIKGYFSAEVRSFENADTVSITMGPWSETIHRSAFVQRGKKSKYMYKGPPGGVTKIILDFDKGAFVIIGKKCDLTGLAAPISVIVSFGDYYGYAVVGESIVNKKKQLPAQLLSGYEDFLRVDKVVCKRAEDNTIEYLSLQGAIAALDDMDLTETGLMIHWGSGQCEIAGEHFKETNKKYTAKISPTDTNPLRASVSIDVAKCVFKIVLRQTSIAYQASPVWFGLECGLFDDGTEVSFEAK